MPRRRGGISTLEVEQIPVALVGRRLQDIVPGAVVGFGRQDALPDSSDPGEEPASVPVNTVNAAANCPEWTGDVTTRQDDGG